MCFNLGARIGIILDNTLKSRVIDSLLIISNEQIFAPHGLKNCNVPLETCLARSNVFGGHSRYWSLGLGKGRGIPEGPCSPGTLLACVVSMCESCLPAVVASSGFTASSQSLPLSLSVAASGGGGSSSTPLALAADFSASNMRFFGTPAQCVWSQSEEVHPCSYRLLI
jgi:hypothetical protein